MAVFITWIILWFQPRYAFMLAFAAALVVITLPAIIGAPADIAAHNAAVLATNLAIYLAIAVAVVALRKRMQTQPSSNDKQIDEELARIRADATAKPGA